MLVKARVSPAGAAGTGSLSVKSQQEALLMQRLGSEERTAQTALATWVPWECRAGCNCLCWQRKKRDKGGLFGTFSLT